MLKKSHSTGFSLVEMLVVVSVIALFSVAITFSIQGMQRYLTNLKVRNDLIAIANALDQYRQDHNGDLPIPELQPEGDFGNYNVLCFKADSSYQHDCATAAFWQTQVDNKLLSTRYLPEVPLDPRSGNRYSYGVDESKDYYMLAGVIESSEGVFEAVSIDNLNRGSILPSLIRSYDGPQFVADGSLNLPYPPQALALTATLRNVVGDVAIINDEITTDPGEEADIYFSDGSISHLDENSHLILDDLWVTKNSATEIGTTVKLKLTAGKLWSKVVRLSKDSEFTVETTNAVAGVRGTEFGVDATTGVVVVESGAVDVKKTDGTTTVSLVAGEVATVDPNGNPTKVAENASSYFVPFEALQTNTLNDNVIPYILGVTRDDGSGNVILDIGFGGADAASYNTEISFEVYTGDQFVEPRMPRERIGISATGASYQTPVYKLSTPYLESAEKFGFVIRAVQGGNTSNFSWPPVGFSSSVQTLSFVSLYPELNPDQTLVVAVDNLPTPQCPTIDNGIYTLTNSECILSCNEGYYELNGVCASQVCVSGTTQTVQETLLIGTTSVGTKTGIITCTAGLDDLLAWSSPTTWTVSCNEGYFADGDHCSAVAPVLLSLDVTSGGHLISAANLTYYPKTESVTIQASTQGTITSYLWNGCTQSGTDPAKCSFIPDASGIKDISLIINGITSSDGTKTLSLYTPELVSQNYIYSKAGASNVDWNAATSACANLTEGGVTAGTWTLPGKDVLAPPIPGATSSPFTYDAERAVWCNYNSTTGLCQNMPNTAGGTPKVHWALEEDLGNSANALIVTFAPGNQPSSVSKTPSAGLSNYGYRCVIAK